MYTTQRGQNMNNFFLPLWNLFLALFVYFVVLEVLKKVGLVKSK
jgi:hypothetical protein